MCDKNGKGCFFSRKDNGRETLDLTVSPLRTPAPTPANARNNHPPPMVIQGDFRKVSGISTEIFKQIETVENDHDASTAAALEHVERRGEMIVRILDGRQLGRNAGEAAKKFLAMQDAKFSVQFVEIVKRPGQTLGLYIREGNGIDRSDGVFISRIALESAVFNSGCLKVGDEILAVNLVDVTHMSLDDVVIIMSIPRRLLLATRQRKGGHPGIVGKGMGGNGSGGGGVLGMHQQGGSPGMQPRQEHKPPPVVVIKRDLRDDDLDDTDGMGGSGGSGMGSMHHDTLRQRHTGDGREMSESRSRLGLGLDSVSGGVGGGAGSGGPGSRLGGGQSQTTGGQENGLDLYYNSRPSQQQQQEPGGGGSWGGYQPPPPPVITEQPKSGMQQFQQYDRYSHHPGTLESLAEKVHAFGLPNARRMSSGGQTIPSRMGQQQATSSHYYIQHSGTGSRRIMPRSGSDQHLPHTEYADYTSITQAGRHSLLRSSLKSGSTLSRYNQRYVDQAAVAAQIAQAKYVSGAAGQYASSTLTRRNRSSLDYSSDTEATCGPRSSYYYYGNRNQPSVPHSNMTTIGRTNPLTGTDIATKFNSLPRDTRGAVRMSMNKRFGDRLLQDDVDGNISAPEMPSIRQQNEYRQFLSRTPSTSAIYEQIRASRDVLNQQRAARFTYSAENIHAALKDTEGGYYSSYGRPGASSTLDRSFSRAQQSAPARSLSTQHITTSALATTRSPSIRRMRQLLDLDSVRTGAPSPVPQTPSSGTMPRGGGSGGASSQRQLDINPAEFLKYKVDKQGLSAAAALGGISLGSSGTIAATAAMHGDEPVSGMLWVHLLAGRGLRVSTGSSAATTPVTPSGGTPSISSGNTGLRDLYCVLECDRVHKARTVVRTGDMVFDWDESFELDLVYNRELDLLIYSWDPQYRHKLCYKGSVHLPSLLKSGPMHQLALKIEPRGTLYLRLRHTDTMTLYRRRGLSNLTLSRTTPLFGVDLESVVNREVKNVPGGMPTSMVSSQQVPIIIKRCIEEIERRGLDIIGLYRLCGSATKKRVLREAFERNSRSVDLTPDNVPDINVITGVLKDYLRELPEPLFTKCLYQMMVDALGVCLPDDPEGNAKLMFSILDCLPRMNRATLIFLMDHLALVVSASDRNKMSAQNLATALAPPLMLHSAIDMHQASYKSGDIDYTQPIGVLKYLLQIWPTPKHHTQGRRGRLPGPRGDSRSACPPGTGAAAAAAAASSALDHQQLPLHQRGSMQSLASQVALAAAASGPSREPSRLSAGPYPAHHRSAVLGQRGPVPPVPSQQIQGPSSVSKGPYRPLSPRVGPPSAASPLASHQLQLQQMQQQSQHHHQPLHPSPLTVAAQPQQQPPPQSGSTISSSITHSTTSSRIPPHSPHTTICSPTTPGSAASASAAHHPHSASPGVSAQLSSSTCGVGVPLQQQQPPPLPPPLVKPRQQVIVSSPGSPSSSSHSADSQSAGSDSLKSSGLAACHNLPAPPSRTASPAVISTSSNNGLGNNGPLMGRNNGSAGGGSLMRGSNNGAVSVASSSAFSSTSMSSALGRNSPTLSYRQSAVAAAAAAAAAAVTGSNSSRSNSPAMQGSSAGMAVTLSSVVGSTASVGSGYASAYYSSQLSQSSQPQPPTYASTNPFLTGAYMTYHPPSSAPPPTSLSSSASGHMLDYDRDRDSSKYMYTSNGTAATSGGGDGGGLDLNNLGAKSFMFSSSPDNGYDKYTSSKHQSSSAYESTYTTSSLDTRYGNGGGSYGSGGGKSYTSSVAASTGAMDKPSYISSYSSADYARYSNLTKSGTGGGGYDSGMHSSGGSSSGLLGVEETPTPTSSIETEDSATREVGERDVEGDGEQSD